MKFLLLGPFSVMDGDRSAAVGKGNERALIALLALHANTVVSTDRIIDALWGDSPPATARDMVRLYVGRARGRVGDRLVTEANGYRLQAENGEVDVTELERLRRAGTDAIAAGDPATAATRLSEAIGLVRGEPLAEFGEFPFAREEIPRLDELRLGTTEEYYDARLSTGEAAELVPALEQLVEENPYRERLRGDLMLALYRAGRQTDALARYQEGRRLLADEVGIEPSPHLRELERAILQHDPGLMPERRESREAVRSADSPGRDRRRWIVPAVLAVVVLGAGLVALAFTQTGGHAGLASLPRSSIGAVDPAKGILESATKLPGNPVDLTGSEGEVWVAMGEPHAVAELDPTDGKLGSPIPVHSVSPRRIGPGLGGVWIADSYNGTMSRVAAANGAVGRPQEPFGRRPLARLSFAGGPGTLWVAGDTVAEAAKVDPRTGRVTRPIKGIDGPIAIATGFGFLWLASANTDEVQRVRGNSRKTIAIGSLPVAIATGSNAVWVVSADGQLWRINPEHHFVMKSIQVGQDPRSVAVGGGSVWVGSPQTGTVLQVSPRTNSVVKKIHIGRPVSALTFFDGRLWVAAS
jgi:DNA-binding SARP family transcriptional activator